MSYHIDVLTVNPDLLKNISIACDSLNKVQTEFVFEVPKRKYLEEIFRHKRDKYNTVEVTNWLLSYRESAKGFHPFMILIVDGFLSSENWANLFGNIDRTERIAVFTTHDYYQFINDQIRYFRYYLARYAIDFLATSKMSHSLSINKNCIFHFKENKEEIKLSLDSGHICDNCRLKLEPQINADIHDAINKMLLLVSNQHPFTIIMKGGGVKGLAFAGALLELEKYFSFDSFAGTSAGALAAILLGAGYKPEELLNILYKKNFKDFKDSSFIGAFVNFIRKRGLYPGNSIKKWINDLLKVKYPQKINEIKLGDLYNRTVVYASRENDGTLVFDSQGERKEYYAAFAARCSMSIPFYFEPQYIDNIRVYDGGLRNNFPLKRFIDDNKNKPYMGLYLSSTKSKKKSIIKELFNIVIEGEERELVESNLDKIIVIDVSLVSTTNFNLTDLHKKYLVLSGQKSALEYIKNNFSDFSLDDNYLSSINSELQKIIKTLVKAI